MARKAIPEATQTNIFLNSRRRCCLCFWLKGEDEVKKGQIAHLDGDNENAKEENLVFLCLDHHDEYDTIPRLSKRLRQQEVQKWRDELYKEMQYRFRTVKRQRCEVTLYRLRRASPDPKYSQYCAEFRLTNTGESEIRSPTVSIRMPTGYYAPPYLDSSSHADRIWMKDARADLFEPNGRIATAAPTPLLLRDQAVTFFGIQSSFPNTLAGTSVPMDYRVDAEEMAPVTGQISFRHPSDGSELTPFSNI